MKQPVKLVTSMLSILATPAAAGGNPRWWVSPDQTDTYAWVGLVIFFLVLLLVAHLYARFDRHVEHRNSGSPLRTTIPMMLTVALAYELMPALSHFSMLLPAALILTAVARDFMLWWHPENGEFQK
ncbi:hypothetical protein C1J03_17150 [Sulfitobacter sp. SK012]|uniref:hypothetical protein n=1 Tax=Sulfitobacter sp. SK012 TaxID=1389005 RepID=UPI000E0A1912|nr:hypothetical protein [Sulfitobacter sp. SK012]AXI47581.1 hypothetical protein C1J03_17150 [Sulfitobacter sp. SK012]